MQLIFVRDVANNQDTNLRTELLQVEGDLRTTYIISLGWQIKQSMKPFSPKRKYTLQYIFKKKHIK